VQALRGERVVLRPLRPAELERIWAARRADAGFPGLARRGQKQRLRERIEQSGRLADGVLDLAIEAEGRLVGDIQARSPRHAFGPGVFELGISLFDGERGRGYGREAVALLTDHLFRRYRAGRVQASTSVGNAAMRRVLERLGWPLEGVMRGFWPRADGGLEDYALYAITRDDWAASGVSRAAARRPRRAARG
jgi:RimJ/RimL family protein N-acetyltransferase